MPLVNPLFGHSGKPTFADSRRDLEGTVVRSAAGVMRAGVFPDHLNPLVTGQSAMRVAIADFRAVQNRGGAVFLANVGADTSVTIAAAPSANRRIDLVYVTMRSSTLGDGPGNDTPTFGVVQGVASATPVAPSLPANLSTAIPLATVEIPAGATTTLSAGVIITQVYPYTAMAGGTVPVRNLVELNAWTPTDGGKAFNIADGGTYTRVNGAWSPGAQSFVQLDSTNSVKNVVTQRGIARAPGSGTVSLQKAIVFDKPFKDVPFIHLNCGGIQSGAGGPFKPGATLAAGYAIPSYFAATVNGFTANLTTYTGTLGASADFYISWEATGELA